MDTNPSNYDVVAYPSYTHPQTHPDRLAVIGSLFGLQPAPATRCRVLELGCGNGSNLLPMAAQLPASEFTGIDLASQPIACGRQAIQALGLKNLHLIHGSVLDFAPSSQYDYIIAHGLYSWVPAPVRERILALCQQCLAPQGIAYVSYNALPGSRLRNMLREMMLFHVRGAPAPHDRISQARALAKFLADGQTSKDAYRALMTTELNAILGHEPGHLFHDELADINDPFYFTQFMQSAGAHGLQYVGEADFFEMFDSGFPDPTRAALQQIGSNRILHEQYLDFLKCRRFRQTLLCHREIPVAANPVAAPIAQFFIASPAQCTSENLDFSPKITTRYQTQKGAQCATDYPLGKAALHVLNTATPFPLPFAELLSQANSTLTQAGLAAETDGPEKLPVFLLDLYRAGVVEFHSFLPPITRSVSARPAVSPLTRWQIQQGNIVTSQLHTVIKIEDKIGRCLLESLDGTHDRNALLALLWQVLKDNDALNINDNDEATLRRKIDIDLDRNLEKLSKIGLLVS